MCARRDEAGRLVKGSRLNPEGRAASARVARLIRDAEALGAAVTIVLPPRPANDGAPVQPESA